MSPFLPMDCVARLYEAVGDSEAAVAVVAGRRQPTIALYRKSVLPKLDAYIASGARRVGGWLDTLQVREVPFDNAASFININSSEELTAANQTSHDQQTKNRPRFHQ